MAQEDRKNSSNLHSGQSAAAPTPDYAEPAPARDSDEVRELREQMAAMKAQIDKLAQKG